MEYQRDLEINVTVELRNGGADIRMTAGWGRIPTPIELTQAWGTGDGWEMWPVNREFTRLCPSLSKEEIKIAFGILRIPNADRMNMSVYDLHVETKGDLELALESIQRWLKVGMASLETMEDQKQMEMFRGKAYKATLETGWELKLK